MANTMMEIGKSALYASQAAIQTTGNNIANVNTPGYTRQYVRLSEQNALDYRPGRMGQGVNAMEVVRYFDAFLEKSYVDKHSTYARWTTDYTLMRSVENIFNEANRAGVSSQMSVFFSAWQDISLRPDDMPTREAMLAQADSLALFIRSTEESIRFIQSEMDLSIQVDVDRANVLIRGIYDLGVQIKQHTMKGISNPNDLMDKRDQLVRDLSELIDVEIYQRDDFYQVRLKTGTLLVDDVKGHFELEVMGPKSETHLAQMQGSPAQLSNYSGNVKFLGNDTYEYTLEITRGGNADGPLASPPADSPQFRVSLDGGKSWLKDDDGKDLLFDIPPNYVDPNTGTVTTATQYIQVKNLRVSFEDFTGGNANFNAGDKFTIVPKTGLYFVAPTKGSVEGLPFYGSPPYTGPLNITPQAYFDGSENGNRITGGSLAAYFNIRDNICGGYLDRLDAVTEAVIWEVNRLHSQGIGLEKFTTLTAENSVVNPLSSGVPVPMGAAHSGLMYYDRLTAGNLTFHVFDERTGEFIDSSQLDFSFVVPPGTRNFDPKVHDINQLITAINNITITASDGMGGYTTHSNVFSAGLVAGKLQIEINSATPPGNPPFTFAMGEDTTGILAALGLNTFFTGFDAANIAINQELRHDPKKIAAGKIDGASEGNVGDNDTAKAIAKLADMKVRISTMWQITNNQSLNQYYNSVVAKVGADTLASKSAAAYSKALNDDLEERQSAVAGVNLDEEMTNLIKFQHSYTAAAKLITTADQMMQTVLGLKQ